MKHNFQVQGVEGNGVLTKVKKGWAGVLVGVMVFSLGGVPLSNAAAAGSVVINEIAWAGSVDSSNDEWIELYNPGAATMNLEGWKLKDDGAEVLTFPAVSIPGFGYFLIEDSEAATSLPADLLFNMSLTNAGDSLELVDQNGNSIDKVNASSGSWYAGNATTKATMERVAASVGDIEENFSNSTGSGATASASGAIIGTPKALNSVSEIADNSPKLLATMAGSSLTVGQNFDLTIQVENLADLFAYGIQLNYDPAKLELVSVSKLGFLSENSSVNTSFQNGLKGGEAGKLLIAEARTGESRIGRSGGGDLFEVTFKALAAQARVDFDGSSFLASANGDLAVNRLGFDSAAGATELDPVGNLIAGVGVDRYQIKLNWEAPAGGVDHYLVQRKNAQGEFVQIGQTNLLEFVDSDAVAAAGKIIPDRDYQYKVIAVKAEQSSSAEVVGKDERGIKGDNNRSDLVDGRDLERLAGHFAEEISDAGFDALIDTTYDGVINGSDLIDLGATFAQQYN
ncbi:MAG: lamin tail domain-containing protein [Candidatus Altimarinota bacterium]